VTSVGDGFVRVPVEVAKQLVEIFWASQWETAHAAENTVCAYSCGEPFEDFKAHDPTCEFVAAWEGLASLRAEVGCTHVATVRR
jgi:hypothetical protein